jgi:hypothetical protein
MSLSVYLTALKPSEVYSANITHNLVKMAKEAGIYEYLWRPEELKIMRAKQLIKPLTKGLKKLEADAEYFQQYNPESGWGDYEGLVKFVRNYIQACTENPNAHIEIDR